MKKLLAAASLLLCLSFAANAQYTRYIVQLKDKKGTVHSLANPSTYLSPKSIERRTRQKITIDSTDLPISKAYYDSIRLVPNVTILNVSKWLNQVLIQTSDANAISKINSFPFVKTTAPIASIPRTSDGSPVNQKFKDVTIRPIDEIRSGRNGSTGTSGVAGVTSFDYGTSFNQIHLHEAEYLHNLGFTGAGITIAILDAGFFGYKTNSAMDSVRLQGRVLGEWDFVRNEQSVNEDNAHGLYCFSIIAANKPGQIMGSAPHAKFYLFRTEDVASEFPVEEQNWVVAAEYADSVGVDMISSSLGYAYDMTDPSFNHALAQRDGNSTIVTIGADLAVKKGMIVTNSAGNSGNEAGDRKFVACPADGDSVFTVGAVTATGTIATFSSWGPNGAGKRKPNIVSVGQGTALASIGGNPSAGNGTSFSNPLACGMIACLWQAFPEFTNMEILDAVQKSAHLYNNPDDRYGYGIPNFRKAHEILTQERATRNITALLGDKWIKPYPNPFTSQFSIVLKAPVDGKGVFQLLDANGHLVDAKTINIVNGNIYFVEFTNTAKLLKGVYFIRYNDGKNKETIKMLKR
jgi:serine protease AprX